jgi:4-amino-4-deoxy-L-arabinose transferase-like glycosyltransferase
MRRILWTYLGAKSTALVLAAVAVVAIVGCGHALMLGDRIRYPDEQDYLAIASNLVAGKGFSRDGVSPTAYRAPGYPVCLAAIQWCGGGRVAQRMLGFVALAVTIVLLSLTVRRIASPQAGGIAALLALAYPVLFYTAGTFYPQTLAGMLLAAALYAIFGVGRGGGGQAVLIGIVFGLLLLTVPTFIFTFGVVLLWLMIRREPRGMARIVTMALVVVAMLMPWVIRNACVFQRPVFLTTNLGIAFYTGNAPDAGPNTGVNIDYAEHGAALAGLSEPAQSAYYLAAGIRALRQRPGRGLRLYAAKFMNHFNYRNQLFAAGESTRWRDGVMLVTYGGLLILTLCRLLLARAWPLHEYERCGLWIYVLNGAFAAIFLTRIRLRVPFDWLLLAVGAITCSLVWRALAGTGAGTEARNTGS